MITYKDMTFCSDNCLTTGCHRHKKNYDRKDTQGLPIAQASFAATCPAYKPEEVVKDACHED